MIIMKHVDGWYVLFDSIYIGNGDRPSDTLLTLCLEKGSEVVYTDDNSIINFPGEYELGGYTIIAFTTKNQSLLHYVIRYGSKKVAYIQDIQALDDDNVSDMNVRYVTKSTIQDAIERRELWWDVVIVE